MTKRISIRITALFLLLTTVFLLLPSCGGGDEPVSAVNAGGDIEETTTEEVTTVLTHKLPDTDWEGRTFTVLGRFHETYSQFCNTEIVAEELTGEIVNDAVFNRNSQIAERYNVTVAGLLEKDPSSILKKYVTAGDTLIDLTFHSYGEAGNIASSGYLIDMYKLPYIDFEMPWWYAGINEELSIGGKLYFTSSGFNLQDKKRCYSMAFNKELVADYNLESPYQLVYDGLWTIDKMTEYSEAVSADIDGDGVWGYDDRYGFGADSRNAFYVLVSASDNAIITKDKDDMPVISMNNEHMLASIDKALKQFSQQNSVTCEDYQGKVEGDFWSVNSNIFYRGDCLFNVAFTHSFKNLSSKAEFDYGVMPYPKFSEAQDHYIGTPDPVAAALFGVPVTEGDYEFTGFMMELLSCLTYQDVLPLYIEVSAKTKYMYDEDSAAMFDITFNNLHYDLGIMFGWGGLGSLLTSSIPQAHENTFASLYAKAESKAQAEMEKTLETFASLD